MKQIKVIPLSSLRSLKLILWFGFVVSWLGHGGLRGADKTTGGPTVNQNPVMMPEYLVSETVSNKHLYVEYNGLRILSSMSQKATRSFAAEYLYKKTALERFYPKFLHPAEGGRPPLVALTPYPKPEWEERGNFRQASALVPTFGARRFDIEVLHYNFKDQWLKYEDNRKVLESQELLTAGNAAADYIFYRSLHSRFPHWFYPLEEQLIDRGNGDLVLSLLQPGNIIFGITETEGGDPSFGITKLKKMPEIGQMFSMEAGRWKDQGNELSQSLILRRLQMLFCAWAFLENQDNLQQLWTFMERSRRELITPKLFEDCFKIPYEDMAPVLSQYLEKLIKVDPPGMNPPLSVWIRYYGDQPPESRLIGNYESESRLRKDFVLGRIPDLVLELGRPTGVELKCLRTEWEIGVHSSGIPLGNLLFLEERSRVMSANTAPRMKALGTAALRSAEACGLYGVSLALAGEADLALVKLKEAYDLGNRRPLVLLTLAVAKLEAAKAKQADATKELPLALVQELADILEPCLREEHVVLEADTLLLNALLLTGKAPEEKLWPVLELVRARNRVHIGNLHLIALLEAKAGKYGAAQRTVLSCLQNYALAGRSVRDATLQIDLRALYKAWSDKKTFVELTLGQYQRSVQAAALFEPSSLLAPSTNFNPLAFGTVARQSSRILMPPLFPPPLSGEFGSSMNPP